QKNEIYAVLSDFPGSSGYRWALYLALNAETGIKFHVITRTGDWAYETREWPGPASKLAVTFTKIGRMLPDWDPSFLEYYLSSIPLTIPEVDHAREPSFTCRVWFKEAVRTLNRAQMFVKCPDVDTLEADLLYKADAAR
ncbi:hypothetical protein EDD18DRAFT_1010709, partial [Armillaria luteobubalina]